ncbi:MAG: GntR family transcriptional regulator [Syntrophobacteraceae bacterium]
MQQQKKNPKLEFEGLVARLESMILTGLFQPRERLIELNLAGTLNVSRFWIRDALKILETKGLVTMVPYKGAMVSNLEEEVIEEIFQVRVSLETLATRLACEKMKVSDIRALKRMARQVRACSDAGDLESMISANAAFHDYIFKLAGNLTLLQIINQLKARCHILRHSSWSSRRIVEQILDEHDDFVASFESKDYARLEELASRHISHAKEFYLLQLKTRKALGTAKH